MRSAPRHPFPPRPSLGAPCPLAEVSGRLRGHSARGVSRPMSRRINTLTSIMDDGPRPCQLAVNSISDDTAQLLYTQTGLGNSDDPFKLANFLNKGGKVIWYHGGSDSLITPFRSFWFYEQLASLNGGYSPTQNNVRMFIVPGMGHCGGGVAPNSFDTLQALHNWVTKGVAPEGIVATAGATGPNPGRTMPLCKFPEEASYSGSGNNDRFQLDLQGQRHAHATSWQQRNGCGRGSGNGASIPHRDPDRPQRSVTTGGGAHRDRAPRPRSPGCGRRPYQREERRGQMRQTTTEEARLDERNAMSSSAARQATLGSAVHGSRCGPSPSPWSSKK